MKQLLGHTSPETAYVVDDYPYGFRLRCKIRYWIETKPGFGQRFVSQTTNPKKPGEVWNKPKASTYSMIRVMYIDESTGHVENTGLSGYASAEEMRAFLLKWTYEDAPMLESAARLKALREESQRVMLAQADRVN